MAPLSVRHQRSQASSPSPFASAHSAVPAMYSMGASNQT